MSTMTILSTVDITTKQTITNQTCFAISFSICAVALLAQLYNVFLVFRRSAGKSRRIFFYLLLLSAILCCLIYVTTCVQLILVYNTGHSYAWIRYLYKYNLDMYPGYKAFWTHYKALQWAGNLAFSLFTVLYIFCVQLRFQAIRAIFWYPKWLDYGFYILTLSVWLSIEFYYGVVSYSQKPILGNIMVAIWSLYVLVVDNIFSGIFLWKLWKLRNGFLIYSSRHGKISRNVIRVMIGLCSMLWLSLFIFGLNPTIFGGDKHQNLTMIITCFATAVFPLFFSLGFAWMEAVLQLYSGQSSNSSPTKIIPGDSENFTLSMKVKASTGQVTNASRDGWASILEEEKDCPYDGSGPMIEMHQFPSITQAAE